MPAAISRPRFDRIKELHEAGEPITRIARKLGLARGTVSKYVRQVDKQVEVGRSPAAMLTDADVLKLRYLAEHVHVLTCPGCERPFLALSMDDRGTCSACGTRWKRTAS